MERHGFKLKSHNQALKQGQIFRGRFLCLIATLAQKRPLQICRLAWRYE
mgnify:CR=1 FL=1